MFFFILLFFLHFNWPLSPCTSKTKTERFILAYFWESSRITHVFNPFLPKKKKLTWNKWNSDFYTIKCPWQNKCVRQLWTKCSLGLIFLSLKSSQLNSVILFVVFIKTTSIEWLAIVFFFNSVAYILPCTPKTHGGINLLYHILHNSYYNTSNTTILNQIVCIICL